MASASVLDPSAMEVSGSNHGLQEMLNVIRIANAFVLVPNLEAFVPHLVSLFLVG